MCRSLIFDRVEDWDQRTVHSCAKHKLITIKNLELFIDNSGKNWQLVNILAVAEEWKFTIHYWYAEKCVPQCRNIYSPPSE